MKREVSKTEAKVWAELSSARERQIVMDAIRKREQSKPKLTPAQKAEMQRKRIEFACQQQLPSSLQAWMISGMVKDLWMEAAKKAQSLGLYSKSTSAVLIAGKLREYKDRASEFEQSVEGIRHRIMEDKK